MAKWETGKDGIGKELVQFIVPEPVEVLLKSAAIEYGMTWERGSFGAIVRRLLADNPSVVRAAARQGITRKALVELFTVKNGGSRAKKD